MHEMAIAISLLDIAEAEAKAQGCAKLRRLIVHYGQIAGIMPEALELAFSTLIAGTKHENAKLELIMVPLRLKCPFCHTVFSASDSIFTPCPNCGEEFGHIVEQGKELLLARLEAEPDQTSGKD